jgi:hypothetical protein
MDMDKQQLFPYFNEHYTGLQALLPDVAIHPKQIDKGLSSATQLSIFHISVKHGQLFRRHAAVVSGNHQLIDQRGSKRAKLKPPSARGQGSCFRDHDTPMPSQPKNKIVVFHDRHGFVAAHLDKIPPANKNRLVAVGHLKMASPEIGHPFDQPAS